MSLGDIQKGLSEWVFTQPPVVVILLLFGFYQMWQLDKANERMDSALKESLISLRKRDSMLIQCYTDRQSEIKRLYEDRINR